jgi:hypothetical protein
MRELTGHFLELCPPSLRDAMSDSRPMLDGTLMLGHLVFAIGDRSYLVDQVFAQIDTAVTQGRAFLTDLDGRPAELIFEPGAKALVLKGGDFGGRPDGLLLGASDAALRKVELERILLRGWLGPAQFTLRKRAAARPFTPAELDDLHLATRRTAEHHLRDVGRQLKAGNPQFAGLEWLHRQGLELLIGDADGATDAKTLGTHLAARRKARLRDAPENGLALALSATIDASFAIRPAPPELTAAELIGAACPNGQITDPFAVLAGLDLALRAGARLEAAASGILEIIEAGQARIQEQLHVYAGGVVIAFAGLSHHPETRGASAIWRRAAAFATAGLNARALAGLGAEAPAFFAGARHLYGSRFDIAVARAAFEIPRWHSLFATPGALHGLWWRRLSLLQMSQRQTDLRERIQRFTETTLEQFDVPSPRLSVFFPGPAEGFRSDSINPALAETANNVGVEGVETESRAIQWRALVNSSLISPPTPQMEERAAELVQSTTIREFVDEVGDIPPEITAASHLIATLGRKDLASQLAAKLTAAATAEGSSWPSSQATLALVVLAAANTETADYSEALKDNLETLAFSLRDKGGAAAFVDLIDLLAQLDPTLGPALARARIAASAFMTSA